VDANIGLDDLEVVYKKAHAVIRKDPLLKRAPTEKGSFCEKRTKPKDAKATFPAKRFNAARKTIEQRKARIRQKLSAKGVKSLAGFVWPPPAAEAPAAEAVAAAEE